jgi:hypothetical protein
LRPTQKARVQIVDEQHRPVANAEAWLDAIVKMRETQGGETSFWQIPASAELCCSADGWMDLPPLVEGGRYTLEVNAPGYASQNVRVRPVAGAALQMPPVVLRASNLALAGFVVDATGKPVQGAQVTIFPWDPAHAQTMVDFMNTKGDGFFHFPNLPKGTYVIHATLWQPTGATDKRGQPINIAAGSARTRLELGPESQPIRLILEKK